MSCSLPRYYILAEVKKGEHYHNAIQHQNQQDLQKLMLQDFQKAKIVLDMNGSSSIPRHQSIKISYRCKKLKMNFFPFLPNKVDLDTSKDYYFRLYGPH